MDVNLLKSVNMDHWTDRRRFLKQIGALTLSSSLAVTVPRYAFSSTAIYDASGLDLTPLHSTFHIASNRKSTCVELIRQIIATSKADSVACLAAGTLHSMGGQALPQHGNLIFLEDGWLDVDTANMKCRVSAGTRWHQILPKLDRLGLSPKIMQSNNDFTVGGTLSANAHGWAVPYGQFINSVVGFDLLLASGELIHCSRHENQDIFSATIGGYGLIGIIIEVELDLAVNQRLKVEYENFDSNEIAYAFTQKLKNQPDIAMAYGRVDVSIDHGFKSAMLISFSPTENQENLEEVSGPTLFDKASRSILRSQTNSEKMKNLRWFLEKDIRPLIVNKITTRNSVLNVPFSTIAETDIKRVDILHEYFLPIEQLGRFFTHAHWAIKYSNQQLLNITLRYVGADQETLLSYASGERIAVVLLFSQEKTNAAEEEMQLLTRGLIAYALELGGSFYPTYRLHAQQQQFQAAFRQAENYVAIKRQCDPKILFKNHLWQKYLAKI